MSNEEDKNIIIDQGTSPRTLVHRKLFVVLGVLIVAGVMGYVVYSQFIKVMLASFSAGEQKIERVQATVTGIESLTQTQQKTLQTLTEDFNQLKQNVANSEQNPSPNKNRWQVEEVRYLVRLADLNLQYKQNISSAIALLKLADQNIRDMADSNFTEVRKALAADIMELQSIKEVDTTGIYMRLLALNNKVEQLPLMNKPALVSEKNKTPSSEENLSWWKKGWNQSLESLRKLVVVRYTASGKIPLVPPEQQAYLYQNWHLALSQTMTALLQGETEIYRSSLQQVITWINEYAMPDTPVVNAFLAELSQLQAIDIHPSIPKISRSLQAVEAITE